MMWNRLYPIRLKTKLRRIKINIIVITGITKLYHLFVTVSEEEDL